MPAAPPHDDAIRVYWQPGCTSCLRTKEYLTRHRVPFLSRNVLADPAAFEELSRFGIRQVPIVTRGAKWANGQVLKDVAALVGVAVGETVQHPPAELTRRLLAILDAALRYLDQIPEAQLVAIELPGRPRSLLQLGHHLFSVADAWIEHHDGIPLTYGSYSRDPAPGKMSKAELLIYGGKVRHQIADWWNGPGQTADWQARADVYYGEQTLHDYLERTTWHCGQHARQLMWMMAETLKLQPDRPLPADIFVGLPMPERVWDAA